MINYIIGAVVALIANIVCYFLGKHKQKHAQESVAMYQNILAQNRESKTKADVRRYSILKEYHTEIACNAESRKMLEDAVQKVYEDLCSEKESVAEDE